MRVSPSRSWRLEGNILKQFVQVKPQPAGRQDQIARIEERRKIGALEKLEGSLMAWFSHWADGPTIASYWLVL
jgi:hypothetical protein